MRQRSWKSQRSNIQHCCCAMISTVMGADKVADSPGELVADHLDVDVLTHVVPNAAHKVLVDPRLELAHPARGLAGLAIMWKRSASQAQTWGTGRELTRGWSCPGRPAGRPAGDRPGHPYCPEGSRRRSCPSAVPCRAAGRGGLAGRPWAGPGIGRSC